MIDYYAVLELPENATDEDIRKAFRIMAKKYHPDVNASQDAEARFLLIHKAYEVLMDRQKRFTFDQSQKAKASTDPFHRYATWVQEQQAKQQAEAKRKYQDFLRQKKRIQDSKMYYPYMVALYLAAITLIGLSLLVLIGCAFVIFQYHIFMFFFLLPFICVAAYILKFTLIQYKKYKELFI
jgi:curved DNA-binding protein CbpA